MTDSSHPHSKMLLFDQCWCDHQQAIQKLTEQPDDDGESGSGQFAPHQGWWLLQQAWLEKEIVWLAYWIECLERIAQEGNNGLDVLTKHEHWQLEQLQAITKHLAQAKLFVKTVSQQLIEPVVEQQFAVPDHASIDAATSFIESENSQPNVSVSDRVDLVSHTEECERQQSDLESSKDEFWADTDASTTLMSKECTQTLSSSTMTKATVATTTLIVTTLEQQVNPVIKLAVALAQYFNTTTENSMTISTSQSFHHNS